jgi:hypothetical protein
MSVVRAGMGEPAVGLFGGKERKRQAFVQKVEDLAGSLQFEFCRSSVSYLEKKYDHTTAVTISADLANYVFRFGYVSPQHASDAGLVAIVAAERPKVLDSFSSIFKMNSTGVLISIGRRMVDESHGIQEAHASLSGGWLCASRA